VLGMPIALTVGYFAAGWLNTFVHWRMTFIILGTPGIGLAAIAWLTLKDPRLRGTAAADIPGNAEIFISAEGAPSLKIVCLTLWRNKSFLNLLACHSVWYFFGYGLLQWTPTFFIRSYGLQTGEIGTWFALIYGLGGGLGIYIGGELASRYAGGRERLQLNASALAFGMFAVLNALAFLTPNYHLGFALLGLAAIGGNMASGPILATVQTLVPSRMRAMSIALIYFFSNLIGLGLGPLAVGALSDTLRPALGEESLRYALLILCPGYLWAAWHLWRAGRTVARDLNSVQIADALGAASSTIAEPKMWIDNGSIRTSGPL
jgi:MFS family permease